MTTISILSLVFCVTCVAIGIYAIFIFMNIYRNISQIIESSKNLFETLSADESAKLMYYQDGTTNILKRAYPTDAGMDVCSNEDGIVEPRGRKLFKTGIRLIIPMGHYVEVKPRSGLAVKNGISTMAGIIDCGYTSDCGVVILNNTDEPFEVKSGDRIAQLIMYKVNLNEPLQITGGHFEDLVKGKERKNRGFGSTN